MKKNWIAVALSGLLVAGCFPGEVVFASDMVKAGTEKTMSLEAIYDEYTVDLANAGVIDKENNLWINTMGVSQKVMSNVIFVSQNNAHKWTWAIQKDGSLWRILENGKKKEKMMDGVSVVNEKTVLKKDGSVWFYQNPDGKSPVKVLDGAVGINNCGALKNDKTLWVWDDITEDKIMAKKVLDNVSSFSISREKTLYLAVKTDGTLWSWGTMDLWDAERNLLGDGSTVSRMTPKKIMDNVAYASAASDGGAALKKDGTLWLWGDIKHKETATRGSVGDNSVAKIVDKVKSVSVEDYVATFVKEDNSFWIFGVFAQDFTDSATIPAKLMDNVASVEALERFVIVTKTDGTVWGWNLKNEGVSPVPVQIMKNAKVLKTPEAPKAAAKK